MLTSRKSNGRLVALAFLTATCFAQNPDAAKFYKLDFLVKEVEGAKVLNSRAYLMIVSTDKSSPPSSIRAGSRVPMPSSPGSSQFTFIELGVSIDCRSIKEMNDELSLIITAEVTSTPQESTQPVSYPLIRSNKWTSDIIVAIKKPTLVFSSEDTT